MLVIYVQLRKQQRLSTAPQQAYTRALLAAAFEMETAEAGVVSE